METYAAYYDNDIRLNSSSGGIFSLLAQQFEIVYGVAMDEDCYGAQFVRAENDISSLRGSKYLQAKVGDTFKNVKKDLLEGKKVLFSGTGCQINGLKLFLNKEFDNLFCVDVICHGTPSPKLWKEYVKYQESFHGKLTNINFRCKDDSWQNFGMREDKLYISKDDDAYMRMFLRDYCLRPSCYECKAKKYKMADMTIADFWGIENVEPTLSDGKGTSLVITRTNKGQKLFDKLKDNFVWKEVKYEDAVQYNPSEFSSVNKPIKRDNFYDDLDQLSFEEMKSKYAKDIKVSLPRKIVRKLKRLIKAKINLGRVNNRNNGNYGLLFTFKDREV